MIWIVVFRCCNFGVNSSVVNIFFSNAIGMGQSRWPPFNQSKSIKVEQPNENLINCYITIMSMHRSKTLQYIIL